MFKIKNIDFSKIVAVEEWILKNNESIKNLKKHEKIFFLIRLILKIIYRSFLSVPTIILDETKRFDVFYIRTYSRPDLNKHSKVYEDVPGTTVCVISQRKKNRTEEAAMMATKIVGFQAMS